MTYQEFFDDYGPLYVDKNGAFNEELCKKEFEKRNKPSKGNVVKLPSKVKRPSNIVRYDFTMVDDLLDFNSSANRMLVSDLIVAGKTHLIVGPPKEGKTLLIQNMLLNACLGKEWANLKTSPIMVLWCTGESKMELVNRMKMWIMQEGINPVDIQPKFRLLDSNSINIDVERDVIDLAKSVKGFMGEFPDMDFVVVFDSFRTCTSTKYSENSEEKMSSVINNLKKYLTDERLIKIIIHHSTKANDESPAGSGAFYGGVDNLIFVNMPKKDKVVNLYAGPSRDGLKEEIKYKFQVRGIEVPGLFDNLGNPVVIGYPEYLGNQLKSNDEGKDLSDKDVAYYDVLVHLAKVKADINKSDDLTGFKVSVESWNTAAKSKGIFADMKNLKSAMYGARVRLENSGYIRTVKPEENKKLTLAYVCRS